MRLADGRESVFSCVGQLANLDTQDKNAKTVIPGRNRANPCTQNPSFKKIRRLKRIGLSQRRTATERISQYRNRLSKKVVIADNDVKASVSSFTHLMTGTVRIGSFASVASVWLPKVIKSFKKRYPEIRFEVLMGDFDEIEHWVKTGRVDFGFTSVGTSDDLQ